MKCNPVLMKDSSGRGKEIWVYWLPVFVYMLLIFILSSQSSLHLSPSLPHFDKICHFIEFTILGFLLARALMNSQSKVFGKKVVLLAIFITILFGLSDEIHQLFVPLRQWDLFDLMADSMGAVFGSLVALWIYTNFLINKKGKEQ